MTITVPEPVDNTDRLLWLDLETTGLDPQADHLLQIAGVLTDTKLNLVAPFFDLVVRYAPEHAQALRLNADPVVRAMHDATNLWGRLVTGTPLPVVNQVLLRYLDEHAPAPRQARLAGSSVSGVDAPFLREFLPEVSARLHYRVVDVSSIAYMADQLGWVEGTYPKKKTHDAADDIRESIDELAWLDGQIAGDRWCF